MSFTFSESDEQKLKTCHPRLVTVLRESIKFIDFTIVYGIRGKELQDLLFLDKKSKVKFPDSKHNRTLDPLMGAIEYTLSDAADIVPRHSLYKDVEAMCFLIGYVKGISVKMGIPLRIGYDFNGNGINGRADNEFYDVAHIELDKRNWAK